jgi:hypothetical protein
MGNVAREALIEIIRKYGTSIADDPKRAEALLRDLCPNDRCEVNLLVIAMREKVIEDLTSPPTTPAELMIGQLSARLRDNYSMTGESATWAVETWALAVGRIAESTSPSAGLSRQQFTNNTNLTNTLPVQTRPFLRPGKYLWVGVVGWVLAVVLALVVVGLKILSTSRSMAHSVHHQSSAAIAVAPTRIIVPNICGMTLGKAQTLVSSGGLTLEIIRSNSDSIESGLVMSQSPAAGTSINAHGSVTARISAGSLSKPVSGNLSTIALSSNGGSVQLNGLDVAIQSRLLSPSDLIGLDDWQLTILRNTVYARHGYRFVRRDLQSYFSAQSWYSPRESSQDIVHRQFNRYEQSNVELISQIQHAGH